MDEQIIPPLHTTSVKTKSQTYFFDVKEAKNGNKYINITSARMSKDGQKFRSTVTVFSDQLEEFSQAFTEMVQKIK